MACRTHTSSATSVATLVVMLSAWTAASADDGVREKFLRNYSPVPATYLKYLENKRVSGTLRSFDGYEGGRFVSRAVFDVWHAGGNGRLDLDYVEAENTETKGIKLSYVTNDYFSFVARLEPRSSYALVQSDVSPGMARMNGKLRLEGELAFAAFCVEGVSLSEFVNLPNVVCTELRPDTWAGQSCQRLRLEFRNRVGKAVYLAHFYFTTNSPVGWRSLGAQFVGRNTRNKQPLIEEYVNTYDDTRNLYLPVRTTRSSRVIGEKTEATIVTQQFDLVSVTDDPKPRSFFTLSEFGLPEPLGMDGPTPFYRRSWFFALVAGLAVVISGVYYLRRRKRLGASDAA